MTTVSVDQINRWNRWAMFCPAYLTTESHPHLWYAVKPAASQTQADVVDQINIWLGCLSDFDKFTDAPSPSSKARE